MKGLRITRARVWHARAVAQILSDAVDEPDWLPRARTRAEEAQIARRLIRQGWVRVARSRGRVVGFIAVGNGEVHGLYLAADQRGLGIGRALLAAAQLDNPRLTLWAHANNYAARRFYAANGFRPVSVGASNDESLTEVRYEWEPVA